MSERVLLTGASSFLGAHLVRQLARTRPDWTVLAVVNRTTLALRDAHPVVIQQDLTAAGAIEALSAHAPTRVVHLACKVADAATNLAMLDTVLAVCRLTGAGLVHGSTTQVGWSRQNTYARGRAVEEERIAAAGVPHVILRPCAPYGPRLADHTPHHRESFHLLADLVRKSPFLPVIGGGTQLRQPVHVLDWNDVITRFLDRAPADLPNRAFDVGGPRALPFRMLVDRLGYQMGKRVRPLAVPVGLARFGALFVDGLTPDLIATFTCDDAVDLAPLVAETGKTEWIRFEDGARDLVGEWRQWTER